MKKVILALAIILIFVSAPAFGEEVKLLFPKFEGRRTGESSMTLTHPLNNMGNAEYTEESLKSFIKKFENAEYKVSQVEIWVEGVAESGAITKFVVSLQGKAGSKITLTPNK